MHNGIFTKTYSMKRTYYAWIMLILPVMLFACKKEADQPAGSDVLKDFEGHVYKTVAIGNQVWMGENLRTTRSANGSPITSYAPNNDEANVADHGRLYHWDDARAAVPAGWRLPARADWQTLFNFLGGDSIAGGKMKSLSMWGGTPFPGTTNSSGFSATGAGYRTIAPSGGLFIFAFRAFCGFWSDQDAGGLIYVPTFGSDRNNANTVAQSPLMGYSVRFIKN
jgi:uncharacterized protein (TIGR02145 family)